MSKPAVFRGIGQANGRKLGGLRTWKLHREEMQQVCVKAGNATLKSQGKIHYHEMAMLRWRKKKGGDCNSGTNQRSQGMTKPAAGTAGQHQEI